MRPDHPCQRRRRRLDRDVVAERCPNAVRCADPFHVVEVGDRGPRRGPSRGVEQRPPRRGHTRNHGRALADAPPVHRTSASAADVPGTRCGRTRRTSPTASRPSWPGSPRPTRGCTGPTSSRKACGMVFKLPADRPPRPWTGGSAGPAAAASRRSSSCNAHRETPCAILAAIEHGLSNGLIESVNTKIRLITRIAFGFSSPRRPHRPRHAQPGRAPPRPPGRQ